MKAEIVYLSLANGFAAAFGYCLAVCFISVPVPWWTSAPLGVVCYLGMLGCHLLARKEASKRTSAIAKAPFINKMVDKLERRMDDGDQAACQKL